MTDHTTLLSVLSKKLNKKILSADYNVTKLHGGTLGDVELITGSFETGKGAKEPFELVSKTQKKWARPGDQQSWRREYDLYKSDFGKIFSSTISLPECYHTEITEDKTRLWIEYIHGVSGEELTIGMLEQAAEELGRFQGEIYSRSAILCDTANLSDRGFLKRENNQWHTQAFTQEFLCSGKCRLPKDIKKWIERNPWNNTSSVEYNYLRSAEYDIPEHLKKMLINVDDNREAIFQKIERLPVVFCHCDFWIENILWTNGKIILIDWDCAGWGYTGEDIASLIADDTETGNLHEYYRRLIPAYNKGISQYSDIPPVENHTIWEMIVLKFGYRIVQTYMFTASDKVKAESIERLQKIYEMRDIKNDCR